MTDFIEDENKFQAPLFPEKLNDYITEDNSVSVIDVFIDGIGLSGMGFKTVPENLGRPAYHPATLLIETPMYNRCQSSHQSLGT